MSREASHPPPAPPVEASGAEPSQPGNVAPLLVLGAAAGALFFAAHAIWSSQMPYRPGFDDAEHLRAALAWRDELRLDASGPFVRVPLWQMLLGSLFWLMRPLVAIPALQIACVGATLAACLCFARRSAPALPSWTVAVALAAFVLSPQALLYLRHPVNEPWIGALAAWVLALGVSRWRWAVLASGLAVGAAAMTKLSMGLLVLPALVFAWRGSRGGRARRVAELALGAVLVVLPLVALHQVQRGELPLDNTSAYTLGEYMPRDWVALGDHGERQRAGMQSFRRQVADDPIAFAAGAGDRLARWLRRPATADFALFVPGFPRRGVGLWENAILWSLLLLAAAGTTRSSAPIWLFVAALPLLCSVGVHVPFVPKILPVFVCVLLAPQGLARIARALEPPVRPGHAEPHPSD